MSAIVERTQEKQSSPDDASAPPSYTPNTPVQQPHTPDVPAQALTEQVTNPPTNIDQREMKQMLKEEQRELKRKKKEAKLQAHRERKMAKMQKYFMAMTLKEEKRKAKHEHMTAKMQRKREKRSAKVAKKIAKMQVEMCGGNSAEVTQSATVVASMAAAHASFFNNESMQPLMDALSTPEGQRAFAAGCAFATVVALNNANNTGRNNR